jgi:hypothetical protein
LAPGPDHYCDCRPPSGGLLDSGDLTHERSEKARSIDAPKAIQDEESRFPSGNCTPGTFRCRQPFVFGHLQVCGHDGVWQISSQCCGPYTCIDPPGDEPPHCECSPKTRSIDAVSHSTADKAVDTPSYNTHLDSAICSPGTYSCVFQHYVPLMICGADRLWHVSSMCCGYETCSPGSVPGTAYCMCPSPRSLESTSLPLSIDSSSTDFAAGPEDPDDPERCSPGRYTCGDRNSKIYVCNSKGDWEPSESCDHGDRCVRGEHHRAYCVGAAGDSDMGAAYPAQSTTLVTVAKEAKATVQA